MALKEGEQKDDRGGGGGEEDGFSIWKLDSAGEVGEGIAVQESYRRSEHKIVVAVDEDDFCKNEGDEDGSDEESGAEGFWANEEAVEGEAHKNETSPEAAEGAPAGLDVVGGVEAVGEAAEEPLGYFADGEGEILKFGACDFGIAPCIPRDKNEDGE